MMNKVRKLAILILIFIGGFWLSGCQLAQETDLVEDPVPDLLCGVYLTWDALVVPSADGGRVYATATTNELHYTSYDFVGYEGIPFFMAMVYGNPGAGDDYTTVISDDHAFGCHSFIHITENEDGTTLSEYSISGKVLVSEAFSQAFYYNQVFETAEGLIYMTPGNLGTMIGSTGIKVETKTSATVNDGNTITATGYEITVECVAPLQQTIIREMNAENQLLFSNVITEDVIPENLVLNSETAYVIVEEYYPDGQGGQKITRTIMDYVPDQELGYGYIVFDTNGIASSEYIRMNKISG